MIASGAARAADHAAQSIPLQFSDAQLQSMPAAPDYEVVPRPPAVPKAGGAVRHARLASETWYNEELTCACQSPDGSKVAAGGYLRRTFLLGHRPKRLFGSRMHVLDTAMRKELLTLETAPVAERTREEKGGSKILDCMFVANARYLAAVTNSKLFLWDVERGRVLGEVYFERALDVAKLEFGRSGGGYFLGVAGKGKKLVYRLQAE
jgi:hypothetical protein